jgi:hypothetical protein
VTKPATPSIWGLVTLGDLDARLLRQGGDQVQEVHGVEVERLAEWRLLVDGVEVHLRGDALDQPLEQEAGVIVGHRLLRAWSRWSMADGHDGHPVGEPVDEQDQSGGDAAGVVEVDEARPPTSSHTAEASEVGGMAHPAHPLLRRGGRLG